MIRKRFIIPLVASCLLAFSVAMGVKTHIDNQEKIEKILSIKKTAFQLQRNVSSMDKNIAKTEVVKLENRILNAESELSPSDEQSQHWLDQSHDIVLEIHKKIEDKKVESPRNGRSRSFPSYLY